MLRTAAACSHRTFTPLPHHSSPSFISLFLEMFQVFPPARACSTVCCVFLLCSLQEIAAYFPALHYFHSCLFIVSRRDGHVCRWSLAPANQRPVYRPARARVRASGFLFLFFVREERGGRRKRGGGGGSHVWRLRARTPPPTLPPPPPLYWQSAFGSAHCCIGGNVSGDNIWYFHRGG